jgi:hypothetical protein
VSPPTFTPLSDVAWAREPVPPWIIEGFLPAGGIVEMFGPSNAGKTFVALGLSTAVALGAPDWLGHRVITPGRVAYAVGEGHAHFPRRLHALRTHYGLGDEEPSGVLFLRERFTLLKPDDVTGVIDAVRATLAGEPLRLLTLDPLAAFFTGGDENSARDMGIALDALHRLRTELATTVFFGHHPGWGNTERERGHSSLRANVDVCYAVKADDGLITLEATKVRDDAPPPPLRLRLQPAADSCVVALATDAAADTRTVTTLTAKQQHILDALGAIVVDDPVAYSRWKTAAGAADTTFDRTVALLVRSGYVLKLGHGRSARYQPPGPYPRLTPVSPPPGAPILPPFTPRGPLGPGGTGVRGNGPPLEESPPRGLPASLDNDDPPF